LKENQPKGPLSQNNKTPPTNKNPNYTIFFKMKLAAAPPFHSLILVAANLSHI